MIRPRILVAAAAAVLLAPEAPAETIVPSGSLFADHSAINVGDVLTILIVETTQAAKSTMTRTRAEADHDVSSLGKLDFFGMWNLDANNSSVGEGSTARRGDLQARMTARITEVTENGLLMVEGTRSVVVNGEEEMLTLKGAVRPNDVMADNTVLSTYLADASIEYTGQGDLATAGKPGVVTRILNWLF